MPEKIIQVSKETLEKRIREGKIKLPGDPVEPSPVNTLGGVPTKEVGRRRFLLGGALTLGGLALAGIGLEFSAIVEYLTLPESYRKIFTTPLASDELPPGWYQVGSNPRNPQVASWLPMSDVFHLRKYNPGGDVLVGMQGIQIDIQILGDAYKYGDLTSADIVFSDFRSSEDAQREVKNTFHERYSTGFFGTNYRWVSRIGDIAALALYDPPKFGECSIAVDKFFIHAEVALGHGDEQTVLSLAKSAVKYLARIGVTPGVK